MVGTLSCSTLGLGVNYRRPASVFSLEVSNFIVCTAWKFEFRRLVVLLGSFKVQPTDKNVLVEPNAQENLRRI